MATKHHEPAQEDSLAFAIIPIGILILLGFLWMTNRYGLYYNAGRMTYWMLWPFDGFSGIHAYRLSIVRDMGKLPDAFLTLSWANNAWRAPAALLGLLALRSAYKALRHPILKLKGPLSVDALMRYQAQINSAIAPIVPIAKNLHKNLDERFHESYHPHEVVEKFRLLNEDKKTIDLEAAETYFIAQLGTRLYRPGLDDTDAIFADRLNDYEKTMFALFAPLAINGKSGRQEHKALLDALNYSAVNARQVPDLRLANAVYAKYRAHPKLNNLFRRHHFSVTYLMQLFVLAKKAGKVTTSEFVGWLRPNANGLFVALNTVGRHTPFTESAGAFAHWEFELACQKAARMPILPCVAGATTALCAEWEFWLNADQRETEETLWGKMTSDQSQRDLDLFRRFVSEKLMPKGVARAGEDSLFDKTMSAERRAFEDAELSTMMAGRKSKTEKE